MDVGDRDAVVLRHPVASGRACVEEGGLPGRVHELLRTREGIELPLRLEGSVGTDEALGEHLEVTPGETLSSLICSDPALLVCLAKILVVLRGVQSLGDGFADLGRQICLISRVCLPDRFVAFVDLFWGVLESNESTLVVAVDEVVEAVSKLVPRYFFAASAFAMRYLTV